MKVYQNANRPGQTDDVLTKRCEFITGHNWRIVEGDEAENASKAS